MTHPFCVVMMMAVMIVMTMMVVLVMLENMGGREGVEREKWRRDRHIYLVLVVL